MLISVVRLACRAIILLGHKSLCSQPAPNGSALRYRVPLRLAETEPASALQPVLITCFNMLICNSSNLFEIDDRKVVDSLDVTGTLLIRATSDLMRLID